MVKFIAFQCQKGLLAAMWEKKRKPWHLKQMYPKPLFCMASHDCKLKITQEKESEKTKALKKSVFIPLGWSLWKFLTHHYDYTNRDAVDS